MRLAFSSALLAAREEVSRAKLELEKAKETLAEIRSGPAAEVTTKSQPLPQEAMDQRLRD